MKKLKWMPAATAMSAVLLLAACGNDSTDTKDATSSKDLGSIDLAYVEWDSEVASTYVVAEVLESVGYDVDITPLDNAIMWEAVSKGEADAMVSGWLPATHAAQFEKYGADIADLGPNLKGAKIGFVVPEYMEVTSIADLSTEASSTITGIEAGAGVVAAAERALEAYPNLASWSLQTSSSGAMTVALEQAIKNEEEIIVTGWSPHWKFANYDLKYLEDPEGVFGGEENIHTFVRPNLEQESPDAFKILDAFEWTTEDIEEVMLDIYSGTKPKEAAQKWIESNEDRVNNWTEGIEK
ncbi:MULTISPECIES: glycine betaine ABC transporter substrate-binding protein [Solibacillus]|uniref:Glycine betaine ABC transporter substrate-binding protein n=1 Tax=Solibacillus merdavium TaxID=2762218 RepID=A0ABR8XJZ5_9BACL|nr:glycine betaine ABC transporter substrate-binding protein [Solibacillus merdavium]MBD8032247.1 glycine betaine ABC transporter substrate-binding protein [Solibacillus merdavium]